MPAELRTGRLAITLGGVGRRIVVAATGDIDVSTADVLSGAIDGAIGGGAADIWIDLTRVGFMDSTGAHVLDEAHARAAELNRRLCVICPPGEPRRVLELIGLTGPLGVVSDRTAAHQAS